MNISEQLDKFVERGAEKYSLGEVDTCHAVDYKAGGESLKPIVLKLYEALEYYANHASVIKEAYHSTDRQITVVHTFINHKAKEVRAEISQMLEGGSK